VNVGQWWRLCGIQQSEFYTTHWHKNLMSIRNPFMWLRLSFSSKVVRSVIVKYNSSVAPCVYIISCYPPNKVSGNKRTINKFRSLKKWGSISAFTWIQWRENRDRSVDCSLSLLKTVLVLLRHSGDNLHIRDLAELNLLLLLLLPAQAGRPKSDHLSQSLGPHFHLPSKHWPRPIFHSTFYDENLM